MIVIGILVMLSAWTLAEISLPEDTVLRIYHLRRPSLPMMALDLVFTVGACLVAAGILQWIWRLL